jgi:hypothetical protein
MEFKLYKKKKKKLLSHYPETKNHNKLIPTKPDQMVREIEFQKLIHIIKQKDCSCLPESEKGSC